MQEKVGIDDSAVTTSLDYRVTQLEEDGGVSDHGALTGLSDDDHTQYALADGSRGDFEEQGAVAAHSSDTTSVHGIADTSVLATDTEVATAVSDHNSDTTSVHGITDTSALATQTYADDAVSTHSSDTTSVHGISDTSALMVEGDAAGGVLAGTYPNPSFASDMATQAELDAHLNDTSDAHDASAISIADAGNDFTATDVEGALAELQADHETDSAALTAHIDDTSDAHDASAISIADSGGHFTGTDVETALQELGAAGGGSGDVASDAIFDAKGDLAVGTGADTAEALTVGANDTILMADSSQDTGLKWAAAASTSELLPIGFTESAGTSDTWARGDHVHTDANRKTAYKPDDETVNNTTTLQADDDLTFSIAANEAWQFHLLLFYDASATADLKLSIATSAGTLYWTVGANAGSANAVRQVSGASVGPINGAGVGTVVSTWVYGFVTHTDAATVTVSWAQNAAEGNVLTVHDGSYLIAERLA